MTMKINAAQLDAFLHVAQTLSFTRAAENLHVTQSALSQRIRNLEEDLETTLFIRDRVSVKLTELGFQLLRYCQIQECAESDLLAALKGSKQSLGGKIRIAGFSSVNRSLVIPALQSLMINHVGLSISLMTREMRDLDDLLKRSAVDYILTSRLATSPDIECLLLGHEENVLVGSARHKIKDIYLDHDEKDEMTHLFFKKFKADVKTKQMRFLDDVYGLIDGVKYGYGIAVLPRHLIAGDRDLLVLEKKSVLKSPVYLQFFRQPYYRFHHQQIIDALTSHFHHHL